MWTLKWNTCFSPTAECYGVFAQYRFRCVLGELGLFREGTEFLEPVPGSGSRSGSGVLKVVPGCDGFRQDPGSGVPKVVPSFEGFGVPGFDGFLMGSEGLAFRFRWGSEGSRTKICRRHVGPMRLVGVGTMRLAIMCGE